MNTRAAIACLFVMVVGAALARRVPDVIERALEGAGSPPVPVSVPFASTDDRESLRDIVIHVRDAAELERYDQIQLAFGGFDTSPAIRYGWLQVAGSACIFRAGAARLGDSTKIWFTRTGSCVGRPGGPADATLRLSFDGPARYARAAVWTWPPPPGTTPLLRIDAVGHALAVPGRSATFRP